MGVYIDVNYNTGGFDDSVLVRFGGIAMPVAIGETLHHLLQSFALSLFFLLGF